MAHTWDAAAAEAGPGSRQDGRKGWKSSELAVMIGGFIVFWPLGLAALGLKFGWLGLDRWEWAQRQWSRLPGTPRICGKNRKDNAMNWPDKMNATSGNLAFDGWKAAELEKLERQFEELAASQKAFEAFLQKLREAKDRETFEGFMASRPQTT